MKRISEFLIAVIIAGLIVGPVPLWATTPGLQTITVPIDSAVAVSSSLRLVPSEQRTFNIYLTDDGDELNLTRFTSSSYQLITYRSNGYKISSMTLSVTTPYTSGILSGTTAATFVTSETYYGVVKMTSGTLAVLAGPFRIEPPAIRTVY